ncbi:FAD-linked sulfhydryl oxidase ALR-like protein [Dinothrombium tinctorium]|uniref:Sulfhydryl oxidase n=1 Tax=Dinothrombium tinctorium TaxID=1965070 RepID=A0A443R167_9ACAR|nr:FAD-linked sulfhydryl oxidase ALR-like protein [Dinothrombium tinctorium]RWS15572.1 FAD-linked sulfhydryl oxidase ALR-like protein [Dinothrombium tinctorium]
MKRDYFDSEPRSNEEIDGKPCRTCVDFKTWAKLTGKSGAKRGKNCPLDKDQLGRNTWSFLHTMAAYFPDRPTDEQQRDMKTFINLFSKFYPCEYCAKDMQVDIANDPPKTGSRSDLSLWFCNLHNKVNKKLGKPLFDCSKVDQRWFHGWDDGSCS